MVAKIMSVKQPTIQMLSFHRKSMDRDGMLIRSDDHLDEFIVSVWKFGFAKAGISPLPPNGRASTISIFFCFMVWDKYSTAT